MENQDKKNGLELKNKVGRPSSYNEIIADIICEEIATTRLGLKVICLNAEIKYGTVVGWITDVPEFTEKYTRAKKLQSHLLVDQINEVAFQELPTDEWGKVDIGKVQQMKLQIDALKWQAGKLNVKDYGDKIQVEAPPLKRKELNESQFDQFLNTVKNISVQNGITSTERNGDIDEAEVVG